MGGYGLSGLVFNNIALLFFNPQHISTGADGLFPESVYKHVPSALRQLAYCYAVLVLIAVLLMFPKLDDQDAQPVVVEQDEVKIEEN